MRIISILGLAIVATGSVHAETREPVTTAISFTKQHLNSESGAQRVLADIEAQIQDICQYQKVGTRYSKFVDQECFEELVANAVDTINSPELTRAYAEKVGSVNAVSD